MTELRVVLADEVPVVRGGLRAVIESGPGLRVVAEAGSGPEAVREAILHRPDVLLLDATAVIDEVLRAVPGIAVLVFTACDDDGSLLAAMNAGARGYLHKGAEPDDIVRAIRGVAAGELIFGSKVAGRLAELLLGGQPFPDLTDRQREVLSLIAGGLPNAAIARRLCLAPKTVGNHISVIFGKLGVPDRGSAIVAARQAGLAANVTV